MEETGIEEVVSRYQRVAPAITRFARSLSGNPDLTVRLGSFSHTGGDEVVCDPRLFHAAYQRRAPVTPEEVAVASALHEVVHLLSSRFEGERDIPSHWLTLLGEESVRPRLGRPEPVDLLTALEQVGGELAVMLFFTLEDARQEERGLVNYPGARSILHDLYQAAAPSLETKPPISQFATAAFLVASGAYPDNRALSFLEGDVQTALEEAYQRLVRIAGLDDPWEVGEAALALLRIAMDFRLIPPSIPREPAAAHELSEKLAQTLDMIRLPSPAVASADSYRQATGARLANTQQTRLAKETDQSTTDQLLRVGAAPVIHLPNGQSGRLVISPAPTAFSRFAEKGRESYRQAAKQWGVAPRQVSGELFHLFAANQRRGLRSGFDQGDISPYAALFIGAGLYQRVYERRHFPTRRRYAVSLLVDGSASMLQSRSNSRLQTGWGMAAALMGAWTVARLCHELQIDFEVSIFNRSFAAREQDTEWSYTRSLSQATAGLRASHGTSADRLTTTVNHYLIKSFDQRWSSAESVMAGILWTAFAPRESTKEAARNPQTSPPVSMFDKAANVDELNVIHAAKRLGSQGAETRLLMVLADGMTRGSVRNLAGAVSSVERGGATVLGIGIGDDTVAAAYPRHQVVQHPRELTQAMVAGTKDLLKKSLVKLEAPAA
jgi:hypothetical protein